MLSLVVKISQSEVYSIRSDIRNIHLWNQSPPHSVADGTNLTEYWFLFWFSLETDDQTTHMQTFSSESSLHTCVSCSVFMYICVYSVNMCGVSRWIAVLICFCLLDDYSVVSGTGGFMRVTQWIHGRVDPSSKRLEKKRNEDRESEKNHVK